MEFDKTQQKAVEEIKPGSILVGGVGSGKSRTALVYFFKKICNGKIDFEDNYAKLYLPLENKIDLYIITTAAKRDKKEWEREMIPFMLEAVVDSWNNISKYVDVKNSFFIFDEQRVVGSGTWSKSFIKISKKNKWILLSATPGDSWVDYIPVFIANGFYKNRTQFYTRHVIWSRYAKYPKIDRYVDEDYLLYLKNLVLVDMKVSRHTVPHKIMYKVDYDKNLYSKIKDDRWNFYEDVPIENPPQYMSLIRKVVNNDESRLKAIRELFNRHGKVIIFYNFDYEREKLLNMFNELGEEVAEWSGHKHEKIPTADKWIYLVQYNAGSEGWECTDTNTIIFFSLNYSYRMTHQASGRIDRRNTSYTDLYYYYLISDSPIDKAILMTLNNKKDFNEMDFYKKENPQILQPF